MIQHEVIRAIDITKAENAPEPDNNPKPGLKSSGINNQPPTHGHLKRQSSAALLAGHAKRGLNCRNTQTRQKKKYSDPKAYGLISLLKTLGKLMEFIIAQRITATAGMNNLFPRTHC